VRESWQAWFLHDGHVAPWQDVPRAARTEARCRLLFYEADGPAGVSDARATMPRRWVTPIFMPKWAGRLQLRLTDVRAEPLQDISLFDLRDEGVTPDAAPPGADAKAGALEAPSDDPYARHEAAFRAQWDAVAADDAVTWAADPWVWVLTFTPDASPSGT
jgi:hypothetical protein